MAIWQFPMVVIPREGLLNTLGQVPEKLDIDNEERTEYYHLKYDGLLEEEDTFRDALTFNWWKDSTIDAIEVIHEMDKRVRRAHWGDDTYVCWKFNNGQVDNDASMSINEETGKIEELRFRADLREAGLTFLKDMIALAEKYDWVLMDMKGNLAASQLSEVAQLIKQSSSYKFIQDPRKFLTDLVEGKIKIE